MEFERALAHIEEVKDITPIEGADRIVLATVLGWKVIVNKSELKVGDKVVYIEIDSRVPSNDERFSFLEKRHYKIKTIKMKGVYSQGLAMPISLFPEISNLPVGSDVTKQLKISYSSEEDAKRKSNKVDPEVKISNMKSRHPKFFKNKYVKKAMKYKWFRLFMFLILGRKKDNPKKWPDYVKRTDECRCENFVWVLDSDEKWIVSEKIDGTSTTACIDFTKRKPDFAVCSRNVRQADPDQKNYHSGTMGIGNVYWEMALKYNFESALTDIAKKNNIKQIVLQGETYGLALQGNPYKMDHRDFAAFNLIFDGVRLNSLKAKEILSEYGIPFVPIIQTDYVTPNTMEELKLQSDGYSAINPKVKREGFVYRSLDGQRSWKNVSRSYLLSHGG